MLPPHVSLMRSWLWSIDIRDMNSLFAERKGAYLRSCKKEYYTYPDDCGRKAWMWMLHCKNKTKQKKQLYIDHSRLTQWFIFPWCSFSYSSCVWSSDSAGMREDVKQREGSEGELNHAEITPSSTSTLTHNWPRWIFYTDQYIRLLPAGRTNKLAMNQSQKISSFPVTKTLPWRPDCAHERGMRDGGAACRVLSLLPRSIPATVNLPIHPRE